MVYYTLLQSTRRVTFGRRLTAAAPGGGIQGGRPLGLTRGLTRLTVGLTGGRPLGRPLGPGPAPALSRGRAGLDYPNERATS